MRWYLVVWYFGLHGILEAPQKLVVHRLTAVMAYIMEFTARQLGWGGTLTPSALPSVLTNRSQVKYSHPSPVQCVLPTNH